MNEYAKRLVAALRSGEYKQGKDFLRNNDDEFCCLGVACDIVKDRLGASWKKEVNEEGYFFLGQYGILPEQVKEIFGFRSLIGYFADGRSSLAQLNDEGKAFSEIADIIESEPEGLFE